MPAKRFVFLSLIFFSLSFLGLVQKAWGQPPLPGHGQSDDGVFGGLSQFEVIINEENPVAGQSFTITIRAVDLEGILVESFGGQVEITTNNTFAAVTGTLTELFVEGVVTHSVTLEEVMETTITATNAAPGQNQNGTSEVFTPLPGNVSSFLVQQCHTGKRGPGPHTDIGTQKAGVAFDLCITALDQFGNQATGFTGRVDLFANNNTFGDDADKTSGDFTDGTVTHTVSLISLSDNTSITVQNKTGTQQGISNVFEVEAGPPGIVEITPQPPAYVLAGEPIFPAPSVIIKDEFGNVLEDIPVDVELIKNGLNNVTFSAGSVTRVVTDDAGHAEFSNLRISQVGEEYQLKFLVGELEKLSGLFVTVVAGAPTAMIFEKEPEESVAGEPLAGPPTIQLVDNEENGVPGYPIYVEVGTVSMTGTKIIVTDGDGLAVFDDLVITQAGNYSLTFSTTPAGVADVTSNDFTVIGTSIDRLEISAADGNDIQKQTAGETFYLRIVAYDIYDNIAGVFDGTVDLTTDNEFGAGVATTTSAFIGGVLDNYPVDLIIATTSNTITATNSDPDQNQSVTSNEFDVTHAPLSTFELTLVNGGKQSGGTQPPWSVASEAGENSATPPLIFNAQQSQASGMLQALNALHNPFALAPAIQDELVPLQSGNNRFSPQVVGQNFDISITAFDEFDNVVLSFNDPVTLTTNNQFGVGVVTETNAFSDGSLASHTVNLRIASQTATITATYDGQSGTTEPFDVNPKPITIEVENATRIYGDPNPQFSFKDFSSELILGDEMEDITGGTAQPSDLDYFTGTNAGSSVDPGSPVGVYPNDIGIVTSSLNGNRADSYSITVTRGELEITRRDLVLINFVADDKVYDGTTEVLSGDGFDDDRLFDDNLIFSYDVAFVDPNVAVGIDVNFSDIEISGGADIGNYSLTVTTGTATATILARPLTITADDQFKAMDDEPFPINEYTVSYDGFAPGEGPDDLVGTLTFTGPAIDAVEIGVYTITASGLSSGNYSITYRDGFLTIGPSIPLFSWAIFLMSLLMVLGIIIRHVK